MKLEENVDELAAIESLDNGKAFSIAKGEYYAPAVRSRRFHTGAGFDIAQSAANLRYMAGWADKNSVRSLLRRDRRC